MKKKSVSFLTKRILLTKKGQVVFIKKFNYKKTLHFYNFILKN